ncbi:homoserine kinase-like [Telopea speciosissima]|uniref:homoserine kinase-like n=1 Tax=Telopea speciosissima TaxID=54955 RepID=UPI001CC3BC11|nr:homoserine kinase-like [Telopea speciosissima]
MAFIGMKSIIISITSPTTKAHHHYYLPKTPPTRISFRCNQSSLLSTTLRLNNSYYDRPLTALKIETEPVFSYVKSFAPATIANVGPGSQQINCAIDGIGDYVSVRIDPKVMPGRASNSNIHGIEPFCAALRVMRLLGIKSVGLSLSIKKGLPRLWRIESKAATTAAVVLAVNELFGGKLSVSELIQVGVYAQDSEAEDFQLIVGNLVTAIMGGFVMIHDYGPLEISPLEFPIEKELFFIFVNPEIKIGKSCRQEMASMKEIHQHQDGAMRSGSVMSPIEYRRKCEPLIPGFEVMQETAEGEAMGCRIIKKRVSDDYLEKCMEESKSTIPGLAKVMKVALEEGALGCKLVGSKVIVAITDDMEKGKEIGHRMTEAFLNHEGGGLKASAMVHKLDRVGARVISRK